VKTVVGYLGSIKCEECPDYVMEYQLRTALVHLVVKQLVTTTVTVYRLPSNKLYIKVQ
jgi:hypothetical protein